MQKNVITCLPSATIQEVARKMAEQNIGSVLLVDEAGKLKGILTDRDIALAVAAEGKDPRATRASEIMTSNPQFTEIDADLEAALRLMNKIHARRLPVTDKGKLVGIISSADVAGAMREQFNQFLGLEETYIRQ
jgi:CBS domain-containing protein